MLALEISYAIVIDNGTVAPRLRSRSSQHDYCFLLSVVPYTDTYAHARIYEYVFAMVYSRLRVWQLPRFMD